MKVVLIYPDFPDTFWSFKHALKFISKKSTHPPLGLLTVAAMLPADWNKKLIDLNVSNLDDELPFDADFAFISAMSIQKKSAKEVISKCRQKGIKVVAGGPLFTSEYKDFPDVDHFVLNEAEITLPFFIEDVKKAAIKHVYSTDKFADLKVCPPPLLNLVKLKKYSSMGIQYSRGCPYNCEFCNITNLFGRKVRTKTTDQILTELENIYNMGWRGDVLFVDDNFIGNKKKLKAEVLPAIIKWMQEKNHPFKFGTEASINLSDDDELMQMMVMAGFNSVFIGIETVQEESLEECSKHQNTNRNMISSVNKLQKAGIEVQGGFIVGFDNDKPSVFPKLIEFIQQSGIITAMVGLLNAPRGTRLYERLDKEKRLINDISGDNTDFSMNFKPMQNYKTLIAGYKDIIRGIYAPNAYYERVKRFLIIYKPTQKSRIPIHNVIFNFDYLFAFLKSVWSLGIKDDARIYYWKLFLWALFNNPRHIPLAIIYSIYGFHFRKVFKDNL